MTRRSLCTPEITQKIADNMTLGLTNMDAAILSGISETCFYIWQVRGEKEIARRAKTGVRKNTMQWKREDRYVKFVKAVKKAIPKRKQLHIGRIQKAARGGELFKETRRVYKMIPKLDDNNNVIGQTRFLAEETVTEKPQSASWQAAAWLLERQHNDEFGRQIKAQIKDWREKVEKMPEEQQKIAEDFFSHITQKVKRD